ncbi:unnamed protein product, partial [Rotaria sp. Silwood2]
MSIYKLYYFNERGRAETSRLIFATGGQKFHDIRYKETGKNNLEQAKVDAVADTLTDLLNKFSPIFWKEEEDENKKKEGINKFMTEELPKHLKNLETLAHSYSNGGYFFV